MELPDEIADIIGLRVIERTTGRHGRIRSGRAFPHAAGTITEVVVCFDGLPEPLGAIGDYYNIKQLDREPAS